MNETKKDEQSVTVNAVMEVVSLVREIVGAFVWFPQEVRVDIEGDVQTGGFIILKLNVDLSDYGLVVGKAARKIQALRTIVQFLGIKERREFKLIFPERDRFDRPRDDMRAPLVDNPNWKPDGVQALLCKVLDRLLKRPYKVRAVVSKEQTLLEIAPDEKEQTWMTQLQPYLHTVFHAIGKKEGAELYVEVPVRMPTPP